MFYLFHTFLVFVLIAHLQFPVNCLFHFQRYFVKFTVPNSTVCFWKALKLCQFISIILFYKHLQYLFRACNWNNYQVSVRYEILRCFYQPISLHQLRISFTFLCYSLCILGNADSGTTIILPSFRSTRIFPRTGKDILFILGVESQYPSIFFIYYFLIVINLIFDHS